MKPEQFLDMLVAPARACQRATGIPASFTLGQAALESGWGSSKLAQTGFNLFGVKADKSWTGAVTLMPTREVVNGKSVTVVAKWRCYKSWEECLLDRAKFFSENKRYAKCFQEVCGGGWARAVAAAGYATDPEYAEKLIATIYSRNLTRFDKLDPGMIVPTIPLSYRIIAAIIVAGAALASAAAYRSHVYRQGFDAAVAQRAARDAVASLARSQDNTALAVRHDAINITIEKAKNEELAPVRERIVTQRVYVGAAICGPAIAPEAQGAGGSDRADPPGRLVREDVERDIRALKLAVEDDLATGRACQAFVREHGMGP